ncbi:meprin A subunit beta-like isoform X2 [Sebastes umbrosus]|uniref:meprin A subunit beta-like isoform X2 n=1 Tax=Sebastes umbrosus TaxID=72105 RepID=UPI0018A069F2|nr:meprin A subunit beta-like isoform X2 [Sebastes umbrosus]
MKGYIFLVLTLAISSAFSRGPNGGQIVDIGEDKSISEANNGSVHDDILKQPNTRSAVTNQDKLWTSPVPYVLDKGLEMNAKGVILRAFDQFRLKSCIDFKPRDSEDYYLFIQKLDGCYSFYGKLSTIGQEVSIGRFCDQISTVEHELLHALGFFHEQSRYDRDDYVTIAFENIEPGFEQNFLAETNETSTNQGTSYDYMSVMHYSKNEYSNGNGSTVITKDPKFQDVIGQSLEMSPTDVLELNLLYKCNSTSAFQMSCSFSEGDVCHMNRCSHRGSGWEMVTEVKGRPYSDHTNLPNGMGDYGKGAGYFMHASTASGQEGASAWLETHKMSPKRECHVQCLQFYFYHSGSESDCLNIWIREFQDEMDLNGTRRLMGQITGRQTFFWQIKHVSLNASKQFQVEFEVRKGAGSSSGGFSIDDINLSELECPHVVMQVNNFEDYRKNSQSNIYSQRHYSRGGYAYAVGVGPSRTSFGLFAQLLSGENDDQLEWPVPQRQVTFQMVDQNPNIQLQMSKQRSMTSDLEKARDGSYLWGNPRDGGNTYVGANDETIYEGPLLGRSYFSNLEEMKSRDFLKGGNAVFVFNFQDITPLVNGSTVPCPQMGPVKITHPPRDLDNGPCSTRTFPTYPPPPPKTSIHPPPKPTIRPLPRTTDDDSIFGISAGLVCSPVLTLLLALMLLIP